MHSEKITKEYQKQQEMDVESILQNKSVMPVFQPVVSLQNGSILGYEALSRVTLPCSVTSPEDLFQTAARIGKLWDLEQLCRKLALQKIFRDHHKEFQSMLFLNVSPLVIHDPKFQAGFTREYLQRYQIDPSQIVFEVTERDSCHNLDNLFLMVEHYKEQQYEIAIDDLGSCYSGLTLICKLKPHYIKLDMALIRDIHTNSEQYALVQGLMTFSRLSHMQLIAEGIETKEELETLIQIGIQYGQGYFLGRPSPSLSPLNPAAFDIINKNSA